MEVKVLLNSIEKIKSFVGIARQTDCDIDLISGKNIFLDAKSLMGILSCNVTKPLILDIHADDDEMDEILQRFEDYIIDDVSCEKEKVS